MTTTRHDDTRSPGPAPRRRATAVHALAILAAALAAGGILAAGAPATTSGFSLPAGEVLGPESAPRSAGGVLRLDGGCRGAPPAATGGRYRLTGEEPAGAAACCFCNGIFSDGFESGGVDAWSSSSVRSGADRPAPSRLEGGRR